MGRLAALLTAAAGTAPTPRELAELLWLARQLEGSSPSEGDGPESRMLTPPALTPPARQGKATGPTAFRT
ncbi:hypothetical protein P1P75_41530, partial [Streptomyces sp. ID05-39B]|uniref:hypothetical protein n=1 Tax=Streptomyces sp. ID05-39B TaxID=3028664 RepID=UPI0029A27828